MIDINVEQRVVIKFYVKLGKSASETFSLLKTVYEESCLKRSTLFKWFKRFQDGHESVEDDPRSGRPQTSKTDENIEKVGAMIRSDRRLTLRLMADKLKIDKECVRQILHENFNMSKVCAKMVPKNLSDEQKEVRKNLSTDGLNQIESDPNFLKRVITLLPIPKNQICPERYEI